MLTAHRAFRKGKKTTVLQSITKLSQIYFSPRHDQVEIVPCWPCMRILQGSTSGTHDPEPTTLLCSCNGVFTDRFIFRLNFPRMRLPQEPDEKLQEIKLTSQGHRTGTAFVFSGKDSLKIDRSVKLPLHRPSMGTIGSGSWVPVNI